MATDLEKARKIVGKREFFVGRGGTMRETIAKAVAEGIALGRQEGIEMAAATLRDLAKSTAKNSN